jgi:GTP-binding protein
MHATIALVGRPNVGKSTLFNRLVGRRDALVADVPGLPRDRRYGEAQIGELSCTLIDTGGLVEEGSDVATLMAQQAEQAIDEAGLVLLIADARAGPTVADQEIVSLLRRRGATVCLLINKIDGVDEDAAAADFAMLGLGDPVLISATHGRGMTALAAAIADRVTPTEAAPVSNLDGIRVAVIGRPNVGKSTLINRWLGEDRQVVFDAPGTTRDSIEIPFSRGNQRFVLIDTAGVRRKGRVDGIVEKFSVVKALDAMRSAEVAVLVIDATEGVVDQDLHLFGYAAQVGTAMVLAVNKWDGLDAEARDRVKRGLDRRLTFAPWVPVHQISALDGTGVRRLLRDVERVFAAGRLDVHTSAVTKILTRAVEAHPPPSIQGRRIKLRYAHKTGAHPPTIMIHGNQTALVPASYTRYLENTFREALDLVGSPVKIEYRTSENPYAGRKNELSPRQQKRRKRVISHRLGKKAARRKRR